MMLRSRMLQGQSNATALITSDQNLSYISCLGTSLIIETEENCLTSSFFSYLNLSVNTIAVYCVC